MTAVVLPDKPSLTLTIYIGSVAKFRGPREDGLNTTGADHVRVQVASL